MSLAEKAVGSLAKAVSDLTNHSLEVTRTIEAHQNAVECNADIAAKHLRGVLKRHAETTHRLVAKIERAKHEAGLP